MDDGQVRVLRDVVPQHEEVDSGRPVAPQFRELPCLLRGLRDHEETDQVDGPVPTERFHHPTAQFGPPIRRFPAPGTGAERGQACVVDRRPDKFVDAVMGGASLFRGVDHPYCASIVPGVFVTVYKKQAAGPAAEDAGPVTVELPPAEQIVGAASVMLQ
ncbi:hypothetical protein ACWGB8_19105 [Kitasatospora sp. NPDC054939]